MLRKVEYKTSEKVDGKYQIITRTGYFHGLAHIPAQESAGYDKGWEWVQNTFAAVEAENGQMVTVDIESIRFLEADDGR